ncbi:hypothetical protein LUU34_01197400 [Aix galericulata]|nr:hypothetical protein LUU34_01197400 [Aix galericulata]
MGTGTRRPQKVTPRGRFPARKPQTRRSQGQAQQAAAAAQPPPSPHERALSFGILALRVVGPNPIGPPRHSQALPLQLEGGNLCPPPPAPKMCPHGAPRGCPHWDLGAPWGAGGGSGGSSPPHK